MQLEKVKSNEELLDRYFYGYNMLISALSNNNAYEGVSRALFFAKLYLEADDLVLYKFEYGGYNHIINQPNMTGDSKTITSLVNDNRKFLFDGDIVIDDIKNISVIPFYVNGNYYSLAISNCRNDILDNFIDILNTSFTVLIEKLEQYENLNKNANTDLLTGLENRNSYENGKILFNSSEDPYIYVIFDLFKLKNINDKYSHSVGDEYIKSAAKILNKFFPKYIYITERDEEHVKVPSGSRLFRIGGDEFVVISQNADFDLVEAKAQLAAEEMKKIRLNGADDAFLGLNYGISERIANESIDTLYKQADSKLMEDKINMHKVLKKEYTSF